MPEYLAPGVYVEETSFRQKTIEGVSTSTAGFVGPARFGPVSGEPELLTSFLDFERIYGGIDPLQFEDVGEVPNDLAHAVRGFFENGGRRLYVSRTAAGGARAEAVLGDDPSGGTGLLVRARHPGAAGNTVVTFTVQAGQDILVPPLATSPPSDEVARLSGAAPHDTVLVVDAGAARLYWLEEHRDPVAGDTFRLRRPNDTAATAPLASGLGAGTAVHVLTVSVAVAAMGRFVDEQNWEDQAPDPRHRRDALLTTFAADPPRRATELFTPLVLAAATGTFADGVTVLTQLLSDLAGLQSPPAAVADLIRDRLVPSPASVPAAPSPLTVEVALDGGDDGNQPATPEYEGDTDADNRKSGLLAFEDLEDISMVAAPGSTRGGLNGRGPETASIQQLLLGHCERMRYRIAVLDAPDGALVSDIRTHRAAMDSRHGALYYPWVTIIDPITRQELHTPPSGFVAGIYARNDVEQGVHKSPANEVVRLAISFEHLINKAQQDVLNPEGINCLRSFEGRGLRVWGARCITSDPEWKYVALRRYFAFLERSIDVGTQWAVFEPNGHVLWSRVRRTIEDFLFNEFRSGHLMGETVEEAFFVTCDRTTMTQSDFDNGRLICRVGVAPLRPAEFVIFRIGQKTLDSRG
jgi:uncharacterized protein